MLRNMIGLLVLAHGLVTVAIWVPDPHTVRPVPPMDTGHSWLLGEARALSLALAVIAGISIVVVGLAFLAGAAWWPPAAIGAGALSLVLFWLFFTPWWLVAIAISSTLVIAGARELAPS